MKKVLTVLLLSLFAISFVSAGATCLTINAKTVQAYLDEIPTINTQLSSCKIIVPASANSIVKDGNLLVNVQMNDGTTSNFFVTIKNSEVTKFTKGLTVTFTHQATLSENTFNKILGSTDALNEVLKGIKDKSIVIKANTMIGKLKWFFAQFFIPNPTPTPTPTAAVPTGPTGKPDNCDETYLPGHRDYQANKQLWDQYSSDTDKVCQSQAGKGTVSPCIHSIQLSISGNPYYLCWYNE